MTGLAIFYAAFAVTVLLTAGLVVGLPTIIQQAQATTSPSQANEHISEQGRAHQSERGAERSGVREPVFCSDAAGVVGVVCFETLEECEQFREIFAGGSPPECERFVTPPPGARFCRVTEDPGITCGDIFPPRQ